MDESLAGAEPKISQQFKTRLDTLGAERKVRAIVMLGEGAPGKPAARRSARTDRSAAVAQVREQAESHLPDVDRILRRYSGKRLASHVDALGCVPVEVTPAGIKALAASEHVRAIFEDQPISNVKI
jgi:hypothetical protein